MAGEKRYVEVLLPLKLRSTLTYRVPDSFMDEVCEGCWVTVPLRGNAMPGVVVRVLGKAPADLRLAEVQDLSGVLAGLPGVGHQELEFWHILADYYLCTPGEVFKAAYNSGIQRAIVSARPAKAARAPKARDAEGRAPFQLNPLSESQSAAMEGIRRGFGEGRPVLLHGVTGSGKTEIYLHLAAEMLSRGRDVLYLVPEIAVSKQLQQRLSKAFGKSLHIYHSQTTVPRRFATMESLRSEAGGHVVLGTRSSIFLPFRDLGLIIVDEEHDRSYKQDDTAPRYNGRDAALMLASLRGAHIVLGSATPSCESLYNVQMKKYVKVDLPGRFHGGEDPEVEVIDTAKAMRLGNMEGSFSRRLLKEMAATLEAGKQVLVFRSRRAYAPVLQCGNCGEPARCPHCNVPLSYHKFNDTMSCHYCGYQRVFTLRCPSCGEPALVERGAGTEKIEEELREAFPGRRIERYDADTTRSKAAADSLIRDFSAGKIDILVGTQMITKGFDFERLALSVIVSADSLFATQDFRGDERALQLLTQLMGRSGRRGERGRIVIQTFQPGHPVLKLLSEKSSDPMAGMLAERREFAYPPYVRMISITVRDRYEGRVWNVCRLIREAATSCGIDDIAGPLSPAVDVVAGEHIAQFWIKLPRNRTMTARKKALYERLSRIGRDFKGHTTITIDVDPS